MTDDLAARRRALGLSQQTVAVRAECSLAMVSLLERGYKPGESEVAERINNVLTAAERVAA